MYTYVHTHKPLNTYVSLQFVKDHVFISVQSEGAEEAVILRPILRCGQNGSWNGDKD